jgi:hypothetical protein
MHIGTYLAVVEKMWGMLVFLESPRLSRHLEMKTCHPSLRSGSRRPAYQILRFAQDDSRTFLKGAHSKPYLQMSNGYLKML